MDNVHINTADTIPNYYIGPGPSSEGANQAGSVQHFINSDIQTQRETAKKMDLKQRYRHFSELKEYYGKAVSDNKIEEANKCLSASIVIAASIIGDLNPVSDHRGLIVNTMQFMNSNVVYVEDIKEPQQRDAAQWCGAQVLLEGNFNGCVEATKLFLELYEEVMIQERFDFVQCNYISSFNEEKATKESLESGEAPGGHALVEIRNDIGGNKEVFLVDASMFEHRMFKQNGRTTSSPSFSDLETNQIIKRAENGTVRLERENGFVNYILFGRGEIPNYQENPDNPYDPRSSNGMTRIAIRNYLKGKR